MNPSAIVKLRFARAVFFVIVFVRWLIGKYRYESDGVRPPFDQAWTVEQRAFREGFIREAARNGAMSVREAQETLTEMGFGA